MFNLPVQNYPGSARTCIWPHVHCSHSRHLYISTSIQ